MRVELVRPEAMTSELVEAWSATQRTDELLCNPFFSAEFARAVATVRSDVEVAVFEDDAGLVGFLPFQRSRGSVGVPLAQRVSEVHGVVVAEQMDWDAAQLLREAGLKAWYFDCVPASQPALQPYHLSRHDFPYVDLRDGFESYQQERREMGSQYTSQALRKARKVDREVGQLRFELNTTDKGALTALLGWKSAQYQRTGIPNAFRFPWVSDLLQRLLLTRTPGCAGMLSALYVEDRVIAVHFGIRSRDVLGWWYPSYDPAFSQYSPGMILFTKLLQHAAGAGIRRIDLGQGDERYKLSVQTGSFPVAEGVLSSRTWDRAFRKTWVCTREWAQGSRLARAPLRAFRFVRHRMLRG